MDDSRINNITQIKDFLKGADKLIFNATSKEEKYQWIDQTLLRFKYFKQKKKDKGVIKKYIMQVTGLSNVRIKKLISRKKKTGRVWLGSTRRNCFSKKYTSHDIAMLITTDNFHNRLSGPATKDILRREYNLFNNVDYKNISNISVSHIYNLRETRQYKSHSLTVKKTSSRNIPIGERRKPKPFGKPGYLRVDSVHQGDLEKKKGVYHINIVDEVTQWQIMGCVERISERFLKPMLIDMLEQIPFQVINFHSDNGSEFINKIVAKLLRKLLINQTKSRARRSNDNALVEGKNGSVIRKHIGYCYIPKELAPSINKFYKKYFNLYLAYHRPCGYATVITDKKGKERKVYNVYQTPYEKFKSLPNARQYLKKDVTFEILDEIAYDKSDNEFAALMKTEKEKLFKNFKDIPKEMMVFGAFISGSYVD